LSEDRYLGINSLIIERSLGKRLEEMMSGKGGLISFLWYLDQCDFVDELADLINEISLKYTFVDTALTKCAKEALSRPEFLREEEIGQMLGYSCVSCPKTQSSMIHRYERVCGCGGQFKLKYLVVHKKLRELHIVPTPEAVMMWVAYEGLADAYVLGFLALKRVLGTLAKQYGLVNPSQFVDVQLKDKFDSTFFYYEPGDMRYSKEERELLMFLVRGNVAEIPFAQAEELIRSGIAVCKFGYLFNKLNCSGADFQYDLVRSKFTMLYNAVNNRIRLTTSVSRKDRDKKTVIEVAKLEESQYYACSLLSKDYWITGKLSKNVMLKPLEKSKFPVFTDEENVAMNCFIAPSGKGKTTFMAATIAQAVDWGKEWVFNVLGDEKNGLTLACLPLFPCEGHTGDLLKILADMDIQPKPLPCLNLVFLQPEEEAKALCKSKMAAHPPTIFDRIVQIDDLHSFGFEFQTGPKATVEKKGVVGNRGVLNILEEFAMNLGYKRVCGLINVRNLLREGRDDYNKATRPDIEVGTGLFNKFMAFRQQSKFPSARLHIDELSRFAPIMHSIAGTDTSIASAVFNESIKGMRGINTSVDTATQSWNEVHPESKKEAFNVFFRELPKSTDKSHSQRDLVLGSLDLVDGASESSLVNHVMETKQFPADLHFWFWWNKLTGRINVVRPNPPFFMLNQPKKTNMQVFQAFERYDSEHLLAKRFGFDSILLDSWDDVPRLQYENDEYFRMPFRAA
jgi:hypothetical protein